MRRVRGLVACFATGVVMAALAATPASAQTQSLPTPAADIVVDASSGCVVSGANIHTSLLPASTVKVMTALVAIERIPPGGTVTADAAAAGVESEKIGFPAGTKWPLEEMVAALMMVSANDAAYSIAHTVGGSLANFATILNDTAKRYGMVDSTLGDPAGLDDTTSYQGGAHTSAYDLAIAARNALQIPTIATPASTYQYHFTDPQHIDHWLTNHNRMLPGGNDGFDYNGATGFKTGYTQRAQHSLIATATRNGHTYIAVILGAPDAGYSLAAALLDSAFARPANAKCPGQKLPPIAVSPYADRMRDRNDFAQLASASAPAAAPVVPASIPVEASAPHGAPVTTITVHRSRGGLLRSRNIAIVFFVLGVTVFFLRRRAVRRQRMRRIARQRQRAAAMRSGGLTIVDGRYRTGMRLGPPVESNVRVQRLDRASPGHRNPAVGSLDLTRDERRRVRDQV
ncbi:MAG TPA: hypothetical protein VFR41_15120 [Acidimicrobiia bacterium]|nr:hypothetical protein [Acidimicrobiia bacterium]